MSTDSLATHRMRAVDFLDRTAPPTPCLAIDLDTVRDRFLGFAAELPEADIRYAVKANPAPEIIRLLAGLGSGFDVAGPAEIDLCLANGAAPDKLSYGNTIKKAADIAYAYSLGVRLFTTDSADDLAAIARNAPGSSVFCRVLVDHAGAATPFGRKFGCARDMAVELLRTARTLGLRPRGIAFHVGSQHTDPAAWCTGIDLAAGIAAGIAAEVGGLDAINLGGGFPVGYRTGVPPLSTFARAIRERIAGRFGTVLVEPGRAIVAEAGVLRSEVILVSRKDSGDEHRWVYLDVGRYGGLAETEGEAIAYRITTPHDGQPDGPVVIAGPTCDGDDVLYQRTPYRLPLALAAGDLVDLHGTGAYTASYASINFNGFPPLRTYCV